MSAIEVGDKVRTIVGTVTDTHVGQGGVINVQFQGAIKDDNVSFFAEHLELVSKKPVKPKPGEEFIRIGDTLQKAFINADGNAVAYSHARTVIDLQTERNVNKFLEGWVRA